MAINARIRLRRGSAAQWQTHNPTLLPGEVGLDLTNRTYKVGNGIDAWNDLPFGGERGASIEFDWDDTQLGVRIEGESVYQYVDLKGEQGIQGIQGAQGLSLEYDWNGTELGIRIEGESGYTYVDLEGPVGPQGPPAIVASITTAERDELTGMLDGLTIYNLDVRSFQIYRDPPGGWDNINHIFVQSSEPAAPLVANMLWIDTSGLKDILKRYEVGDEVWVEVASGGGGATGGGLDEIIYENDQVATENYEITENRNGMTTGPLTIEVGVVITVPTGSRLVIL